LLDFLYSSSLIHLQYISKLFQNSRKKNHIKKKTKENKIATKIKTQLKIQTYDTLFWENILYAEKCQRYVNHVTKVFPHVVINGGYFDFVVIFVVICLQFVVLFCF